MATVYAVSSARTESRDRDMPDGEEEEKEDEKREKGYAEGVTSVRAKSSNGNEVSMSSGGGVDDDADCGRAKYTTSATDASARMRSTACGNVDASERGGCKPEEMKDEDVDIDDDGAMDC